MCKGFEVFQGIEMNLVRLEDRLQQQAQAVKEAEKKSRAQNVKGFLCSTKVSEQYLEEMGTFFSFRKAGYIIILPKSHFGCWIRHRFDWDKGKCWEMRQMTILVVQLMTVAVGMERSKLIHIRAEMQILRPFLSNVYKNKQQRIGAQLIFDE